MDSHLYIVKVKWSADRKGAICIPEIMNTQLAGGCLEVATPPEFPNGMEGYWSPEHLFTAAVASCLMTTFLAIAENSKLQFISFECMAEGKLEKISGKFQMTAVTLKPIVEINNEQQAGLAKRVLAKSEENCLISNSIRSIVTMEPTINYSLEPNVPEVFAAG